eukprot:COSAG01_NODE_12939_length_1660_cov_0.933376_2_plen_176_part_00
MSRLFLSRNIEHGSVRAGLLTWREMLELARIKGGCVVQMIVPPGLSKMQVAEADMAADKGVPVVVINCEAVLDCVTEAELVAMPAWTQLLTLIQTPAAERSVSRTRQQLEKDNALLKKDNDLLKKENEFLRRALMTEKFMKLAQRDHPEMYQSLMAQVEEAFVPEGEPPEPQPEQ